jgi:Family of unknown function (DUF6338)
MPTTLTGLLLFVVLLLPGFAYLVGKERHGTARSLSSFRETVGIVSASVTSELVVLGLFAAVRAIWPTGTPSAGALLANSGAYLHGTHGHPGHFRMVVVWGVVLLSVAVLGAYLATIPTIRRAGTRLTGPYPHDSTVSAWWILFERWPNGRDVQVACMLDDGSAVRGQFGSFNTTAEDSPDRDLILQRPIFYRPSGEDAKEVPLPVSAACFPARRVVTLFVSYSELASQNSTGSQAQPGSVTQVALPGPVTQAQPASAPSAASPAQSGATPTSGAPTLAQGQSSTRSESAGLSALLQRLWARRPW